MAPTACVSGAVCVNEPGRRLYLIRHGKADRRSGREAMTSRGAAADPPLDETGIEQAVALARRLQRMPAPAAIYCSALARARQTIEPYVEATGAVVTYLEDLVEWFGGDWEFKEFEELIVLHPEIPSRILLQDPLFFLAPGGEPFVDFQDRVVREIEGALRRHSDGDVWIICHGGVINAYVGWVLGIEEQEMFFLPPNTSINTVRVLDDRRQLWFLADDAHVTEPELFADGRGGASP
jgi:probable phosphoglycerate mutase